MKGGPQDGLGKKPKAHILTAHGLTVGLPETKLWAAAAAAKSLQSCPTLCDP